MPETETTLASIEVPLIAAGEGQGGGSWMNRIEEHPAWPSLARVPETLTALIPLRQFTVRSLLLLDKGQTLESDRSLSEDIPMKIGAVQIAWGEFEVVEHRMALRVTRVA
ncbi:MAG TPA: FliM/FliN family flagellar motor C-terminal domain-containing protein [Granulicella sp.]|jgi:flagellar motor switch protein FliN/FliY|nr:FliM/FliN family flagellar motor C-terminal domain-containing protein [Granulicella sp.]